MKTYVIGDVQGCYEALQRLLTTIHFNAEEDTLWFVGDLVNRGDDSLGVLRFIKSLGSACKVVLGNHDLHLLALAEGVRKPNRKDTMASVLEAKDCNELLTWLRKQPLLYVDTAKKAILVHAGIYPFWTLDEAVLAASRAESQLKGSGYLQTIQTMYGNEPAAWRSDLSAQESIRFAINVFTRMRFCDKLGYLDFEETGTIGTQPPHLTPWFQLPMKLDPSYTIYFGHWAALDGRTQQDNRIAVDTGCIWGGRLAAYCIEEKQYYYVKNEI